MKILSVRQPWAWAIIHAGKDIENRSWQTLVRGRVLVHAAKGMTRAEYHVSFQSPFPDDFATPGFDEMPRGGIVGSVEIVDCVTEHPSSWFFGPYGFVLRDPRPIPFIPLRGRLGFFDAPPEVLDRIGGDL